MGGTSKFEDTLAARLNLMQPSEKAIAEFLEAHPPQLSEGVFSCISVTSFSSGESVRTEQEYAISQKHHV